jgi:cell division protein FtsB
LKPADAPARPDSLRSVVGAATAFVLVLLVVAGVKSYRDLAAARAEEARLTGEIGATRERIQNLHGRIERLRGDPVTLERLAREELGLVRPDDVVIVLPPDAPPRRPPARRAAPAAPSPAPAPLASPAAVHGGVKSGPPGAAAPPV